jgi:sterol desaturase/sphingolipid hydroxylase (fatty acid hydroxylase superfamily)
MARAHVAGRHFVFDTTERIAHSVVNYWLVLAVDVLGAAVFLVVGIRRFSGSRLVAVGAAAGGFCAWGLIEYVVHRFVMHGRPSMARRGHALHHADDRAFISTPVFIIMTLAVVICAMLTIAIPAGAACLLVFGLYAGYNYYALLHHVQHHQGAMLADVGYLARLERAHRIHHDQHRVNYGVSTTIWDRLLGTFQAGDAPRPDAAPGRRARSTSMIASLRRLHP